MNEVLSCLEVCLLSSIYCASNRDILHRIQSYTTVGGSNLGALCHIDICLFIDDIDCASC